MKIKIICEEKLKGKCILVLPDLPMDRSECSNWRMSKSDSNANLAKALHLVLLFKDPP